MMAKAKEKIAAGHVHFPTIVKVRSSLLQGNYKDRRLVYLNSAKEIKDAREELARIIEESIALMD